MLQKIKKLINEYADIYAQAWATGSFRDPIASMVRNEERIQAHGWPTQSVSVGVGRGVGV